MKQIVFILLIFLILPFCVHAKKAVFGYSGSYWEGHSLEELNINDYGVAANFEGERSKWGLRLLYNIQILNLKIFYSNSSSSQEIQSQLYGLEIFYKNQKNPLISNFIILL